MTQLTSALIEQLYNLEMLHSEEIGEWRVTRVPAGWIFKSVTNRFSDGSKLNGSESSVFVPFRYKDQWDA